MSKFDVEFSFKELVIAKHALANKVQARKTSLILANRTGDLAAVGNIEKDLREEKELYSKISGIVGTLRRQFKNEETPQGCFCDKSQWENNKEDESNG